MRARIVQCLAVSVIAALALEACTPAEPILPSAVSGQASEASNAPTMWPINLNSPQEQTEVDLQVLDQTGHVTGLVAGPPGAAVIASRSLQLGQVEGQPATLSVGFALTRCERRPTIGLVRYDVRMLVSLDRGPRDGVSCDAMAIPYSLHILFDQAVQMSDVVAHDEDGDANTWGFLVPTIGPSRGLTVVDYSRHLVSVGASPPFGGDPGSAGIAVGPGARPDELTLSWLADPCETSATLTLEQLAAGDVPMRLDLAPQDPATCEGQQLPFMVTLRFSAPVSPEAVQASVNHAR